VIVSVDGPEDEGGYIWEFEIPEDGPVAFEDVSELLFLDISENPDLVSGTPRTPLYGLSDEHQRIYFNYYTGSYPYTRNPSYIQKNGEEWDAPILIVQRPGGTRGLGSVMEWDYDNTGVFREVIAYTTEVDGIDQIEILDVDECVETAGQNCVVVDGIEGWDGASFTTRTEGQLPALLYLYDVDARNVGCSIRECDLTAAMNAPDTCYRTVIEGIKDRSRSLWGVDSAD
jgi:hypothetical protein